jgi:hypothetical protein
MTALREMPFAFRAFRMVSLLQRSIVSENEPDPNVIRAARHGESAARTSDAERQRN